MLSSALATTCLSYYLPGASTTDYYERKGGEKPPLAKRTLVVESINVLALAQYPYILQLDLFAHLPYNVSQHIIPTKAF
jgi:hypothetical protein